MVKVAAAVAAAVAEEEAEEVAAAREVAPWVLAMAAGAKVLVMAAASSAVGASPTSRNLFPLCISMGRRWCGDSTTPSMLC